MPTMIDDNGSGESRPSIQPGVYDAVAYMIAELGTNMHSYMDEEPKKEKYRTHA